MGPDRTARRRLRAGDAPALAEAVDLADRAGDPGRRHRRPDPRHHERRSRALSRADRRHLRLHPRGQLDRPAARAGAADRPPGDRRRARPHRLRRDAGLWRAFARPVGLSRDFRGAELGDDPAQPGRADHAHFFSDRAPVRQCDERRFRDRHRAHPRRPLCADPPHGARTAHRRRSGLHLRRARDRLHRRGGRRADTNRENHARGAVSS